MKRKEFIDAIATEAGAKKNEAQEFLEAIERVAMKAIATNEFVPFAFGRVGGKDKPAKTARNPKTGETINVSARTGYPYCKFSSRAKE